MRTKQLIIKKTKLFKIKIYQKRQSSHTLILSVELWFFVLAAVVDVETRGSHLTVTSLSLPFIKTGLCCPLEVEEGSRIFKALLPVEGQLHVMINNYFMMIYS